MRTALWMLIPIVLLGCNTETAKWDASNTTSADAENQAESPNALPVAEEPRAADAENTTPDWLRYGGPTPWVQDSDGDGIPDEFDADPYNPPQLVTSGPALRIDRLYTPRPGVELDDQVMPGADLVIESTGLFHYGGPWWLRWHHANGIFAQEVLPDSEGRIQVKQPEVMPYAVSLVAATYATAEHSVQALKANAPRLYPIEGTLRAGSLVSLKGERLDQMHSLRLGDQLLQVEEMRPNAVVVRLPELPTSQTFNWEDDRGDYYYLQASILRPVTITTAYQLIEPGDWSVLTDSGLLRLGEEGIYWVPAGMSRTLHFYQDDNPLSVSAVVLPHQTAMELGARSSLKEWIWSYHVGAHTTANHDYGYSLPLVADQLSEVESLLLDGLNGDLNAGFYARQAFHSQVKDIAYWPEPAQVLQERSWWRLEFLGDTVEAIMAGGNLYQPIVKVILEDAVSGTSSYANVNIGYHRSLTECTGMGALSRPSDMWPSDLCVQNMAPYYVSLRVVDSRSGEVLKDHITHPFDTDLLGGSNFGFFNVPSVAYLTGNNQSLCKMRPCHIEVLTGGLGWLASYELSQSERAIANQVLGRTLLELVVMPAIGWATNSSTDSKGVECIAKSLLVPSVADTFNYGVAIDSWIQGVNQSSTPSELTLVTASTIISPLIDILIGMAGNDRFAECLIELGESTANKMVSSASNRLGSASRSASVPVFILNRLNNAYQGWQLLTAPRKIVFDVAPRASITEITTSSGRFDERVLYSNNENDFLRLYGTHLADPLDDGYWPTLVLTDRSGRQERLLLDSSHAFDTSDMSWVDLRIRVQDLRPLVQGLSGNIFNVSLELDHGNYSEFPDGVLPLPGTEVEWIGDARLTGVIRPILMPGERGISLYGENLGLFNQPGLSLEFTNEDGEVFPADRVLYNSSTSIRFGLSEDMPPGRYHLRLLMGLIQELHLEDPIEVVGADSSFVTLLDRGPELDDEMDIQLLSGPDRLAPFGDIIDFVIPSPNKDYSVTIAWEEGQLMDFYKEARDPARIEILCIDGGDDGYCTWRLQGRIVDAFGFVSQFDESGNLPENEVASFNVNYAPL